MSSKILLFLSVVVFFIFSSSVFSVTLEDFESSSWQSGFAKEIAVEGSLSVGIETISPYSGKQALSLNLDLPAKLQSDNTIGTIDNEFFLVPQTLSWDVNPDALEYFVYYIRSDISGFVFSVNVYTKKTLWTSGQSAGGSQWKQIVIPLKSVHGTNTWDDQGVVNDENIPGFTIPQWYRIENDIPVSQPNPEMDLDDIQKIGLSFNSENNLKGKVFLDSIQVVNDLVLTIPPIHSHKSYYYNKDNLLKIYFGPQLQNSEALNSSFITVDNGSLNNQIYNGTQSVWQANWNIADNQTATITIHSNVHFKDSTFLLSKKYVWSITTFDGSELMIDTNGASVAYGEDFIIELPENYNSEAIHLLKKEKPFQETIPNSLISINNKIIDLSPHMTLNNPITLYWKINDLNENLLQYSNLKIYVKKDNQWEPLITKRVGTSDYLIASSLILGEYAVLASDIDNDADIFSLSVDRKVLTLNSDGLNDTMKFYLELNSDCLVTLEIYDSQGRMIRRLAQEEGKLKGLNTDFSWDGKNEQGNFVPSGIYVYHIKVTSSANPTKSSELNKIIGVVH